MEFPHRKGIIQIERYSVTVILILHRYDPRLESTFGRHSALHRRLQHNTETIRTPTRSTGKARSDRELIGMKDGRYKVAS
jgi:hypothetical protein